MKPETRFRNSVHVHLPPLTKFHRQSLNAAAGSFNGTPDMYYDGEVHDLWVEYKYLPCVPKSGILIGAYTKLQLRWMTRRWKAGQNVWGIVGCPNGGCIQYSPGHWAQGSCTVYTRKQIAEIILGYCNGKGKQHWLGAQKVA